MSVSIDWITKIITIPQLYLEDKGGGIYELDIDAFRLDLRDLEDGEEGIVFLPTHQHNSEVVLSGTTYSRMILIINGYTITFEDGQYAVNAKGANSNIADVMNVNQVSLRSFNAAGLITVTSGSGVTEQDIVDIADLVEERLIKGNMAIQPMAATEVDNVRNVRIGDLDRVVYKWKLDTDSDWDSPRKTQTHYAWYQVAGDGQPIMKEDG